MTTETGTNQPTPAPAPAPRKPMPAPSKPAATIAPTPKGGFLQSVTRGVREEPLRLAIHGTSGIGKTSFAACAPSPIFIDLERGSSHVDVARFPTPESWTDVLAMLRELATADHSYETVVIDTLDALEHLIWHHLLDAAKGRWNSIEAYDGGYGRGWAAAAEQFQLLTQYLDKLQTRRGMNVILLAHSTFRKTKNAMGDDWERFALDINEKAANILREWAEDVLFAAPEVYTDRTRESKDGKNYQAKAVSTGRRVLHTAYNAAYDAKNRHSLPETIDLSWDSFYEMVKAGDNAERATIVAEVNELLPRVSSEVAAKATAMLRSPLHQLRAMRDRLCELAANA